MINAAAMLAGLLLVWLLLVGRFQGVEAFAWAGAASLLCVIAAARLGAVGGRGAYGAALQLVRLSIGRAGAVMSGAGFTLRAALGLKPAAPALVLVRTRPSSAFARATLCNLISAAPGATVIESDSAGLLVHVLDEERVDGASLSALEGRVIGGLDGKAAL